MTLLLAEDDLELARQVQEALAEAGHSVQWVTNGGRRLGADAPANVGPGADGRGHAWFDRV